MPSPFAWRPGSLRRRRGSNRSARRFESPRGSQKDRLMTAGFTKSLRRIGLGTGGGRSGVGGGGGGFVPGTGSGSPGCVGCLTNSGRATRHGEDVEKGQNAQRGQHHKESADDVRGNPMPGEDGEA